MVISDLSLRMWWTCCGQAHKACFAALLFQAWLFPESVGRASLPSGSHVPTVTTLIGLFLRSIYYICVWCWVMLNCVKELDVVHIYCIYSVSSYDNGKHLCLSLCGSIIWMSSLRENIQKNIAGNTASNGHCTCNSPQLFNGYFVSHSFSGPPALHVLH